MTSVRTAKSKAAEHEHPDELGDPEADHSHVVVGHSPLNFVAVSLGEGSTAHCGEGLEHEGTADDEHDELDQAADGQAVS